MHKLIVIYILFAVMFTQPVVAHEQIRAVGSATVYPFATVVAEQFGQGGKFKTPIVESTGTGGGFKLFCEGIDTNTPDINNASRKITESEKQLCSKNGVADIIEIPIGYDGIVFAIKKDSALLDLSKKDIFLAMARELPDKNGQMVKNPYNTWHEIDKKLPDNKIELYGPPPTSGTRDAFVELVMDKGCAQVAEFAKAYPDEKERKKHCSLLREDGKYIEDGDNSNVVVQKLSANEKAIGIITYSFMAENVGKVQASKIEEVLPSVETIDSGEYSVSRRLYIYVKAAHIGTVSGIQEFINELTSENAIGDEGYVIERGLLPLRVDERLKQREIIKIKMSEYGKI